MKITVSEYIARFLQSNGVKNIFTLSGGMIIHMMDTIKTKTDINLVTMHHEQSSAFAADTIGRLSNIPGIALATSGPGALNLLTGIGSSFFDSSPALFITGQVNTSEQKGSKKIRQLGFQETDIVSIAKPVTKYSIQLKRADEIKKILPHSFLTAKDGRPGPCLIDIPMNLFRQEIDVEENFLIHKYEKNCGNIELINFKIENCISDLYRAKRPLVLAGHGVHLSDCKKEFHKLISSLKLPVVNSLHGNDLLPFDDSYRVGMIGTYGNRWANLSLSKCDFLLVLGSRLDIRQTGSDTDSFIKNKKIYHIDIDISEINNRITNCVEINTSLKYFFKYLNQMHLVEHKTSPAWLKNIETLRNKWPDISELKKISGINPNYLMHQISKKRNVFAYTVDVGLHQMWAAQSLELSRETRFITSGGMGAMGFALPSGIACCLENDLQKPVVVIAGDAGFQLNIQELQFVKNFNLPLKIIVMNNKSHGMTRQFQDTYYNSHHIGSVLGYSAPDFVKVAQAYGLKARLLDGSDKVSKLIDWFWRDPKEPCLLEVQIDQKANAYPKIAFGRPVSEMEPFSNPIKMEGT